MIQEKMGQAPRVQLEKPQSPQDFWIRTTACPRA